MQQSFVEMEFFVIYTLTMPKRLHNMILKTTEFWIDNNYEF